MAIRSFLAFELPAEIRRLLTTVSEAGRATPLNVRWVRPANIHLTVVFMGSVQEAHIDPIKEAAGRICRSVASFPIQMKGAGFFGSRRNPRVLWMGLGGDVERMSAFRDDLQKSLAPFGIQEETRPFRPHLTLGRFRKGGPGRGLEDFLSRHGELGSAEHTLDNLVLFKSNLKPGGAVYTRLSEWALEG